MGYIQGRFDHDWYNAKRPIRSLLFSGVASGVWARSKIDRTNTAAIAGTPPPYINVTVGIQSTGILPYKPSPAKRAHYVHLYKRRGEGVQRPPATFKKILDYVAWTRS